MSAELKGVKKVFSSILRGRVEALRGIDLKVEEGEFFVILGPSGSGKSTLLNILAGLEKPTSGEVYIKGRMVAGEGVFLNPGERRVAMVFQNYALYPHMTVRGNIAFPLRMEGMNKKEIERRVREVALLLGIEHLLNSKPAELSGGEKQRVAIARALVREPDLLLMDEPLSNLDARLRIKMKEEIRKLQRSLGLTTIYVTHDQTEAMTLADRLAVMREGSIEQMGEPMDIYRNPGNTFVAGFIGNPPMNIVKKKPAIEEGKYFIDFLGVRIEVDRGEAVYLGVRPEDIEVKRGGSIEVTMIERLGGEALIHLRKENDKAIAKIYGDCDLSEGERVEVMFKKYYLFDS